MPDQVSRGLCSPLLRRYRLTAALPFIEGKVLDIGCGTGELARHCTAACYLGVDIDDQSIATARQRWPNFRFQTALPTAGPFDTIVGLAVIEHIADPGAWLHELASLLAPGGRIVVTTPHPAFESIHRIGGSLGLFSRDAVEEHETLLDGAAMTHLAAGADLSIAVAHRFLLGANQLFVLTGRLPKGA